MGNQSEVARLVQRIREEHESARLALSGLASGTGQHEFITQKMERWGNLQDQLNALVGSKVGIELVAQALDMSLDATGASV